MIISSCLKDQARLYERYGYEYIDGGENYSVKGTPFSSLYLTKDMIIKKHKNRILEKGLEAEERCLANLLKQRITIGEN